MTEEQQIKDILFNGSSRQKRALFAFDSSDSDEAVLFKFDLWSKYFKPDFFECDDALFHKDIDRYNLRCYREQFIFIDIAFRGAAKTARTKLFIAFVIANDIEHKRKYFKVLSHDSKNGVQIVTDIYNIFVQPRFKYLYPEIFEKTDSKKEERMDSFTTATGIKIVSSTVGKTQRGALQDSSRPDFIWFEDFEDRETLRSSVKTKAIWDNMEEARLSLSSNGSAIYTCNYISEAGNVHKLVIKDNNERRKVLIVPIVDKNGNITWESKYTKEQIEFMKKDDDDFEGERMCNPQASKSIYFYRQSPGLKESMQPIKELAGFKIYHEYNPSHEYASGHDISGGVGLDSSTSVFIDFSTYPAQVVATFYSNTVKPDVFAHEIKRQVDMYGNCLAGIEKNNHGHATIAIAKQLQINMFETQGKETRKDNDNNSTEYGWLTNQLTKPKMLSDLHNALKDGLLILNDIDLINETKGYTRNDLLEFVKDPSLTTRHFDLLIACAIAWQMKDFRLSSESRRNMQIAKSKKRRQSYTPMTKFGG